MDNAQKPQQTTQQPSQQPAAPPTQTAAQQVPVAAASQQNFPTAQQAVSVHPERGPVALPSQEEQPALEVINEEVLRASTPEVSVPEELQKIVEKGEDAKQELIDSQLEDLGVSLVDDATLQKAGSVQLPMTYQQAEIDRKKSKIRDSLTWLATLVISQWKKLNPNAIK